MAPVSIVTIGMAGSGKTTFIQRLNANLHAEKKPPYLINLDPAVLKVPFGANIDIRDSVKYKKVMEDSNLGPNGAIMTSLNLFSTKIDQVIKLIERRADTLDHVVVDTPGQIECFIWSASGSIINEALASTFPTVIAYVVDTPRTASPSTFMSNMLYACSILYKTKLPMIIVFNKSDVKDAEFAKEWMQDFEAFQIALKEDQEINGEDGSSSGYMGSLINSMSLMLEEFYSKLDVVGVSSYTGEGFDEFLTAVDNKVGEYETYYKSERERILNERTEREKKEKQKSLQNLMKDLDLEGADKNKDSNVLSDYEESDDEYEGEVLRDEEEAEGEAEVADDDDKHDLQSAYNAASGARTSEASKMMQNMSDYIKR